VVKRRVAEFAVRHDRTAAASGGDFLFLGAKPPECAPPSGADVMSVVDRGEAARPDVP